MMKERFADALEALIHAELCHPDDTDLALYKIRIMMNLDNFDRAFELALALENKAYDSSEIHVYKGHIYTMNDDIENAVKEFKIAFEKNTSLESEELYYIPDILMEQKYFNEALIFLHKFIDLGDANAKILFDTGFCYEQISNVEEAEKYYEKALDEDPFNEKAWVTLGALYLNSSKNIDKALEAFKYAHSINNSEHVAMLCKLVSAIKTGNYDKTFNCIMRIMPRMSDNSPNVSCHIGEHDDFDPKFDEIEQDDMEFINQIIDFESPYWGMSKLLYVGGDFESAIKYIDKAIETDPDNENYLYFRGQCIISLSNNKDILANILQNSDMIKDSEKLEDAEFMNKYKQAVFFYNIRNMEDCCKYLLEAILINSEGLEMFFNLFPKAKENAYIINYFGKYLK
jgi:tetratricopeptide (TPR) repeat protein